MVFLGEKLFMGVSRIFTLLSFDIYISCMGKESFLLSIPHTYQCPSMQSPWVSQSQLPLKYSHHLFYAIFFLMDHRTPIFSLKCYSTVETLSISYHLHFKFLDDCQKAYGQNIPLRMYLNSQQQDWLILFRPSCIANMCVAGKMFLCIE